MKNTVIKIVKITGAGFCALVTLAGIINTVSPPQSSSRTENLILTIVFLAFTVLLIRSIRKTEPVGRNTPNSTPAYTYQQKPKGQSISPYLPEVPVETLREMKKYYTAMQMQNDVRIAQESFQLVQQTTDFDTFFMRLELSQNKALTLLQAVQAGCKGIVDRRQMIKNCEAILSNTTNAKMVFLDNSYKKETASAMQLKTKSGQCKRLTAYLDRLKSYEDQFMDVEDAYTETVDALQNLIAECQPDNKKTVPRAKAGSTADEIMKFKQLLDTGAISQEEYEHKKNQLLNL